MMNSMICIEPLGSHWQNTELDLFYIYYFYLYPHQEYLTFIKAAKLNNYRNEDVKLQSRVSGFSVFL